MTPLTRKENYLNEIVGWGNTAPEKPTTPEEFFFAAILGEAVQVPDLSNASRYELFLAKIAGYNVNVLPPTYTSPRLEFFLAKAAGMDVVTPVPLTKEEIFWANYKGREQIIEGIPPLMFKSNGANLSSYRIYGNTVNGESVGDLVESGEHAGEYLVPVTINSNTTSIYLPHQIRKVGDDAEYIDYGEQKQHRVRKNLLQNTATSQIINGVTFTVNNDGSVTCNGTPNSGIYSDLLLSGTPYGKNIIIEYDNYIFSCIGTSSALVAIIGNEISEFGRARGNDVTFDNNVSWVLLRCYGVEEPQTVYPMIRKVNIENDTYEPYIENTELDVTLPALPTLSGTNTLSFKTTVQPLKVMIKTGKFGTHKVRYYDSDGTFLSAEDVKDGTNAQGFTPTKASTVQYNYTFVGWSTTKGSTTAETGVLNDITADKSLYAVFSQFLRTFTVYFYNGNTLLQTAENVQYGGTATYTGETPTKDGFTFSGWQPSNVNITADTSCYAQFVEG